jgi:hypothetical protein
MLRGESAACDNVGRGTLFDRAEAQECWSSTASASRVTSVDHVMRHPIPLMLGAAPRARGCTDKGSHFESSNLVRKYDTSRVYRRCT